MKKSLRFDVARLEERSSHVQSRILEVSVLDAQDLLGLRVVAGARNAQTLLFIVFFVVRERLQLPGDFGELIAVFLMHPVEELLHPRMSRDQEESISFGLIDQDCLEVSLCQISDVNCADSRLRDLWEDRSSEEVAAEVSRPGVLLDQAWAEHQAWTERDEVKFLILWQGLKEVPSSSLGQSLALVVCVGRLRIAPVLFGEVRLSLVSLGLDSRHGGGNDHSLDSMLVSSSHDGQGSVDCRLDHLVWVFDPLNDDNGRSHVHDLRASLDGIDQRFFVQQICLDQLQLIEQSTECLLKWLDLFRVGL